VAAACTYLHSVPPSGTTGSPSHSAQGGSLVPPNTCGSISYAGAWCLLIHADASLSLSGALTRGPRRKPGAFTYTPLYFCGGLTLASSPTRPCDDSTAVLSLSASLSVPYRHRTPRPQVTEHPHRPSVQHQGHRLWLQQAVQHAPHGRVRATFTRLPMRDMH
jgi:hypothetical protein